MHIQNLGIVLPGSGRGKREREKIKLLATVEFPDLLSPYLFIAYVGLYLNRCMHYEFGFVSIQSSLHPLLTTPHTSHYVIT